ncbi:hypothetical protein F5884DRAFT_658017 [Xylogone sp. PMI_703]|nr:hypothetical protein F5884DRAFT_658017 [Xylogone sp. PMI_703]
MASSWKNEPEDVADRVLRRAEVSKMARKLQNRLALAQFKAVRGWEDLTLDKIEPKVEEELRRSRPVSRGDMLSDSSSSTSDFHYPTSRTLLSSPLKAPFFSDQIHSSGGSNSFRKRTFHTSFDHADSTGGSRKRFRSSPAGRSLYKSHAAWKGQHQFIQSSPIKPRKHSHFTTSTGPGLSFYKGSSDMVDDLDSTNFAAASDEDDALPLHSFSIRPSTPRTPSPIRNRSALARSNRDKSSKSGEEGADLLLYLATSPSPANPAARSRMQPPSTPPPRNMALPSSMMTTPGGGGSGGAGILSIFGGPSTPSQAFDFADFVNITPSPAQNAWPKTPGTIKTPLPVSRRRLTFENMLPPSASPGVQGHNPGAPKTTSLGMPLGGDLIA